MITPDQHFELYKALERKSSLWRSYLVEIARYVYPQKLDSIRNFESGITTETTPDSEDEAFLFDNTAIQANQTLANGQLSWMTPHESPWFAWRSPMELDGNDNIDGYFRRCTEIGRMVLAQGSNFYSEIHELYLDRGGFGSALILTEPGKNRPLTFSNWNIGSYCLGEDDEGEVSIAFRKFTRTALQLAEKFGYDNLPEKVQKCCREARNQFETFEVIHGIFPRKPEEADIESPLPIHFPYASVFQLCKDKTILREGGYREKPFAATRFLRWGDSVYGYSPSWMALPESRQLNFLEKQLDALAEVSAFPRLLLPSYMEDDVDIAAGGQTYFDPAQPNAIPREWLTGGRYDIGIDRANRKRDAINEAFFVDLFKMFANIDKEMTAREVMARSAEKVTQFSPTFARMTTELFNPLLTRIFAICARQGLFPPPPEELIEIGYLPDPKIEYSSRIAMAIASLENASFAQLMELILPIADRQPDILDNYNWDVISRDIGRNSNTPERWMNDMKRVEEIRAQRARQMAQQAQAEQMAAMAKSAKDIGSIPPESPIAGMMEKAA